MTSGMVHDAGSWIEPATNSIVTHGDLLARMAQQQVVLLGETHDRYDIHRWQTHVCAGLFALRQDIAVGFEMFPRRVQPVLDRWVAGEFDVATFLLESGWDRVWRFDPALYLPIFEFCRQFRLPMLALNCERPLVTRVGKEGWDAIPVDERDGLTPAKPASAAHRRHLFTLTGGARPDRDAKSGDDPAFDRFVRAQQTWDRAFACNIARFVDRPNPPLVVGIIGRGHMEHGHGTPFQLDDLGISRCAVLLPSDTEHAADQPDLADAVFRLPGPPERAGPLASP
ncbi:MAG: hypothetical protein JWQ65_1419 [Devosia sp.]|nr:hypothetical protein [Devosia sp.]